MYNLLNIYDCPKCGKRLSDEVTYHEEIDTERDEIYPHHVCDVCGNDVEIRKTWNEENKYWMFSYEEVGDERARWAHGFYDEHEDDEDESYSYTCPTYGGEIAEDYSTCWCEDDEPQKEQTRPFENAEDDLPF